MNYNQLVVAVKNWADKQRDVDVDSNFDYMIKFAESIVNRKLRISRMSKRAILNPQSSSIEVGYYALPNNFNGMRILRVNGCPVPFLSPEQIFNADGLYYCIMADQLYITGVTNDDLIEMVYYQTISPITETSPTNWLLSSYPDVYLSGVMFWLESFVKNYEVAAMWESKMYTSIGELVETDFNERWSGIPLQVRA